MVVKHLGIFFIRGLRRKEMFLFNDVLNTFDLVRRCRIYGYGALGLRYKTYWYHFMDYSFSLPLPLSLSLSLSLFLSLSAVSSHFLS